MDGGIASSVRLTTASIKTGPACANAAAIPSVTSAGSSSPIPRMPTASAMAAKLGFWSSVPSQWTSAPLDEAQCTVVEHRNFHGETVLGQGKKISHQHGEAAVARERNHLPTGKGRVRAYCLR